MQLPSSARPVRLVRVYPRMLVGGAEAHILQLLREIPGTEMVVPGVDGAAGVVARGLVDRYTVVSRPRLAETVRACRGADLLHAHVINNDPILGVALQLAGPHRLVLTVHNNLASDYATFADRVFAVGVETQALQSAPGRVVPLPEGVEVPAEMPAHPPLEGRPLRIVEVRRADKAMAFTLGELVRAGALDGVDFEARVVGVGGESGDPRIAHLGEQGDPSEHVAWADLVLHGSAAETFGRVIYEAMAQGALGLCTPLPAYARRLRDGEQALIAGGFAVADGVALLRRGVAAAGDGQARIAAHAWVREHASTERMVAAQLEGYTMALARPAHPRSILPEDVDDATLPAFGAILDILHRGGGVPGAEIDALPPRARALVWWTLAELRRGDLDLQVRLLAGARRVLGDRPALLRSLARALREAGRVNEAIPVFLDAIAVDPDHIGPYLELADARVRVGDRAGARELIEALRGAVPSYTGADKFLAALGGSPRKRPTPFADLRKYRRIIVTGPHRSGTTIAAEMIAADTGHEAVREEAFEFYREDLLRKVLERDRIVVQCPALFDLVPALSDPDTAVVLMRRPLEELADSRGRMFDPSDAHQLSGAEQNEAQLRRLGEHGGDAAALKYARWDAWVAEGSIHHPVVVDYASLARHPMWVPPAKRRELGPLWHNRRTQV